MTFSKVLFIGLALNLVCITFAFDTTPLIDFCVPDNTTTVKSCKDPATVTPNDFYFSGLNVSGNTSNPYRASLKVARIPGLNGLGMTLTRLDFASNGSNPPHYHPRGTEILTVLEGSLEVGFITSYPNYRHISKVLEKGDVFVVPVGLLHYQRAVGPVNTVVLSATNSQNPGIVEAAAGLFGSQPPISSNYLAGAFLLDEETIEVLQSKFKPPQ